MGQYAQSCDGSRFRAQDQVAEGSWLVAGAVSSFTFGVGPAAFGADQQHGRIYLRSLGLSLKAGRRLFQRRQSVSRMIGS